MMEFRSKLSEIYRKWKLGVSGEIESNSIE
jgi:hypothetical protein